MRPIQPHLTRLLNAMLASGDVVLRARAENFRFEERAGPGQQKGYETARGPAGPSYEDWLDSHMDYLAASVYTKLPETFLP